MAGGGTDEVDLVIGSHGKGVGFGTYFPPVLDLVSIFEVDKGGNGSSSKAFENFDFGGIEKKEKKRKVT